MTEKQISELEQFASAYLSDTEIGLICGIADMRRHMENPMSDIYKAVMRGRLKTKAAINMSIVEWAQRGSSPAQQLAKKLELQLDLDSL